MLPYLHWDTGLLLGVFEVPLLLRPDSPPHCGGFRQQQGRQQLQKVLVLGRTREVLAAVGWEQQRQHGWWGWKPGRPHLCQ